MLTPLPILIRPSPKSDANKVLHILFANQPGTYISWSPLFHSLVKKQTYLNLSRRKMEQTVIPKKTTECIEIWHFSCISAVRHIRERNTPRRKLISTLSVHPEMSVSEAGQAMKGGPNMKNEIHVKFTMMKLPAKKLASPSKACNWEQAIQLFSSQCWGTHTPAAPCTLQTSWRWDTHNHRSEMIVLWMVKEILKGPENFKSAEVGKCLGQSTNFRQIAKLECFTEFLKFCST